MSSAKARPCSIGNIGSAVPWITSVGTSIADSGRRGCSPSARSSWFCAVAAVDLRRPDEAYELLGRRWEFALARQGGGGADQDEREHPFGELECEELRKRSTCRDPHHVGRWDAVSVEDGGGVGDQVETCVAGLTGRVGDRAAGVAVVVADDVPAAFGEHPAEALVPPEHRCAHAHDEQDRRGGGGAGRVM